LILVPRMGTIGAALATTITVITTNLWLLKAVRSKLKLFPYNSSYLKLVFPTLLSTGVLLALGRGFVGTRSNWEFVLVAIVAAYGSFLAMIWISGLDSYDREIAQTLWAKVSRGF
ncbi:MAG: hypothetical protein DMG96_05975, partial [Acidobacteria bacterium]